MIRCVILFCVALRDVLHSALCGLRCVAFTVASALALADGGHHRAARAR